MATINIPQWRTSPKPVQIKCSAIKPGSNPHEMVVQFKVNGDSYTLFVTPSVVNIPDYTLSAMIIADLDDGFLIDLPSETLTSGPRIQISNNESKAVLLGAA